MKSTIRTFVIVNAIGAVVLGSTLAGTLDPPGLPAPTMVTLQQIYDRLSTPTGVAQTGQTTCTNASGTVISCAGTGQDGALLKGVTVSPRFTDNGNGTVTDNLTGLIWLKTVSCFGSSSNWNTALSDANTLHNGSCGLTDGSAAGDWRLPNIMELLSLIDNGQVNPALPPGHPFTGVGVEAWSSTTHADVPSEAWWVALAYGAYAYGGKTGFSGVSVWPVRGGR
jgi:hypothetical protein